MHIICPHCSTSYAINPATLGAAGRTVRCSRCKEVWLARPEDAAERVAAVPAMATAGAQADAGDTAAEWPSHAHEASAEPPVVDSPSIAADWGATAENPPDDADWPAAGAPTIQRATAAPKRPAWYRRMFRSRAAVRTPRKPLMNPFTACAAMGALVLALMIWRVEVVRLMPQTASFYRMVGLDVNLRGLTFKDVKITSETVDGKPVLVIEGVITGEAKKPVELPRLRFSVRDAQGAEIYAWNAVLEQPVLKPGERAWFKSRLASPPPEGRNIDVRFFNRRDIASGHI